MVHTLPDYTTKYRMTQIFGQIDTGELAARLGSPSTQDRRGNVIWMDDFEHSSAKWDLLSQGDGAAAAINNTRSWTGSQSMKHTTASDPPNFNHMRKDFSQLPAGRIGAELQAWFSHANIEMHLYLYGYSSVGSYEGALKLDLNADTLSYQPSVGDDVVICHDVPWVVDLEMWLMLKLVIDWENNEYIRAILGHTVYDLSGIPLKTNGTGVAPRSRVYIYFVSKDNNNREIYVDNFILTQNEP